MKTLDEIVELIEEKNCMEDYIEVTKTLIMKLENQYPKLYKETLDELEGIAYSIDKDMATGIVTNMKPYGEHWSLEEIKNYLETKGIENQCIHYYLVMNMVYNDYMDVAVKFGHQDDVEFFFELAHAFINDVDAKSYKVERYFL